jgi:hypothetical protein
MTRSVFGFKVPAECDQGKKTPEEEAKEFEALL